MQNQKLNPERRTTTDHIFSHLYDDIVSLKLLPGSKMSEAEVADKFGVSRQPVRDAFNRLGNLDLLLIRPQRATVVRGFSMDKVNEARFLRLAVELEAFRSACLVWDASCSAKVNENIKKQDIAINTEQWEQFHELDFQFHALICEVGGCEFAADTIKACRTATERLCALSLNREKEVETIVADHKAIVEALDKQDVELCGEKVRLHLTRLDRVIEEIQEEHAEYFE